MDPELIDPELIYAKTASGEEAMLQRTRVVQRNVRMVLILVDGNATVAELCNKTGNAQLTEHALLELEDDGFIERRADEDSVWIRGRKPGQKGKGGSAQPVSEFSVFGDRETPESGASSLSGDDVTRIIPFPEGRTGRPSTEPLSSSSLPPSALTPPHYPVGPQSGTVFLPKAEAMSEGPAAAGGTAPPVPSLWGRLQDWLSEVGSDLKPIRRGQVRLHLTWPVVIVLGVLSLSALLALLVLIAWVFPYGRYLPEVEAALARSTGQSARVEQMHVTLYPMPGLLLTDVRLGDQGKGDAVRIAELRLQPVLGTLLSSKVLFREMALSGISLSAKDVDSLARIFESAARQLADAGVQRVAIAQANVTFAGLGFDDLSGEFELSADGLLQAVSLHSPDRSLQLDARPTANGLVVSVDGLGWRPSPRSRYRFDSFSLKGTIDGSVLVIDSMDMRVFDGRVSGALILRGDGPPAMAGEITFERINSKRFSEALGIGEQFEGDAAGKLKFSAMSPKWSTVFSAVHADGEFTMSRGSLGGIDLPEAVRRASATPATLGGATRFEQLSGAIRLTPDSYRFSRLVLHAGTMQSTGQLEVSRDLQLRGRMDVQMRARTDQSATPVSISGSLKTPQLQIR